MAIGKVGAFATVQAPNVDFGEIALNAQKFQAADLEKQKELKVAQLKAEKEKPYKEGKEAPTYTVNTGLKGGNEVVTDYLQKNMTRLQILNNKEANEGLLPQEVAEQTQLKTSGKQVYDFMTALTTTMKEDNGLISTASEVSSDGIDLYQKALKTQGLDRFEMTPDGDLHAYFYKTKEDPITNAVSLDLDKDGKPQPLTKEDGNGNIIPSTLSYKDVVYGDFKQRIVQPTDVNELVDKTVKGTGYNTIGSDTGIIKDVSKNVTANGLATMKLSIKENLLKNNNSTLDILSRMAKTNTYKDQLQEYKYTGLRKVTDKELDLATEYVNNLAVSKLDTSNVRNVLAPEKNNNTDGGDGNTKLFTRFANAPAITKTDVTLNYVSPSGKTIPQIISKGSDVLTFAGRKAGKNENLISSADKISAGDFYRTPKGVIIAKVNEFKKYTTDAEGNVNIQDPTPNYKLISSNIKGDEFNRVLSLLRGDNETSDGKNINIKTISDLNRFFDYEKTKDPKYLNSGSSPYGAKKRPTEVDSNKMITVSLPNGQTGQIPSSQIDSFMKKYPNAKRQ